MLIRIAVCVGFQALVPLSAARRRHWAVLPERCGILRTSRFQVRPCSSECGDSGAAKTTTNTRRFHVSTAAGRLIALTCRSGLQTQTYNDVAVTLARMPWPCSCHWPAH
jgi:hypothetical protein